MNVHTGLAALLVCGIVVAAPELDGDAPLAPGPLARRRERATPQPVLHEQFDVRGVSFFLLSSMEKI